jgi:glutamine amidotransferase|tara:strand:+ start:2349 stop:2978 length:630 start_codon:yes stop_codon:yes gene_type:complete
MSEFENKKICLLDFKTGNTGSVSNLLEKLNIKYCVSNKNHEIESSSHLILPGVGSFEKAINNLKNEIDIDLIEKQVFDHKKPILGICVGMQIMAENGNEFGNHKGLGWIEGKVDIIDSKRLSLPHVGWNTVEIKKKNKVFNNFDKNYDFYFVNSYCMYLKNKIDILATSNYGSDFPSIINKNNIYGFQFHPEKSQRAGKMLLKNFFDLN